IAPPPMMTIRALSCIAFIFPRTFRILAPSTPSRIRGMSAILGKRGIGALEPRLVLFAIAGVVEQHLAVDLLDPRPQRLAQLGGDYHRGEAAQQSRAG